MTSLPPDPAPLWPFGITLAAICIPFFSIIGFLSTNYGYRIWAAKTKQFWHWMRLKTKSQAPDVANLVPSTQINRTMSTEEGMRLRLKDREAVPRRSTQRPPPSHPHIQRMVEKMGEGRESGLTRMGTVVDDEEPAKEKDANEGNSEDTVIHIES